LYFELMKSESLAVSVRTELGRQGVKRLRHLDQTPAVIYGRGLTPQSLQVDAKKLENLIHHAPSEAILVELEVSGDSNTKRTALVHEVQHHPLNGNILHVDFQEIGEGEQVTITVPIEPEGEAVGVKTGGGILEHVLFFTKLTGHPKDLPEVLTINVSALDTGESIHLGEISLPEGVTIVGNPKLPVCSISQTRASRAEQNLGEEDAAGEKKEG
jgi:large subunit ribosomal protein L25